VIILATSSINHSIHIEQEQDAKKFVDALKYAQMKKIDDAVIIKAIKNLTVEEIREIFGE
jgi:hypothetical protein